MIRIALIITLLANTLTLSAQYYFSRSYDIPVSNGSFNLKRAWEGGLNYPIFSNADFDGDGKTDLIAFDKSGNRILLYNNDNLQFEPFQQELLLDKWVLFRDFNCDGKADIFTGTSGGIRVYRNTGDFTFVLEKTILQSQYGSFSSNLYVSNEDVPGIVDVDGDGDLDVLTFEINGARVDWHKNLSMENHSDCDHLEFEQSTTCWGNFKENATTNAIDLNTPCGSTPPPIDIEERHAGSTITTLDRNYDGDIDLLVSDISFNNIIYLDNGGSNTNANMTSMDTNFPSYDNPINFYLFPYVSYADYDFDGKSDLIVASNNKVSGNNKTIQSFKNIGVNQDTFSFQSNGFLVEEMLDFGAGAYPILIDENQDGLLDLIVGNTGYNTNGEIKGRLALLRNIGTLNNPAFNVETYDYLNLSTLDESYLAPTSGDIDGDGDEDLLIGLSNGKIIYYNNTAGFGNPCTFVLASGEFEGIDVGAFAAPQLFDFNNDDLLDLFVGNQDGKVMHYPNGGTSFVPDYSFQEDLFGGITTKDVDVGAFHGYAVPHFFKDGDTIRVLVGSEDGGIYYYPDVEKLQGPYFYLETMNFQHTKDGGRSSVITHDLNGDNHLDLFIGNLSGGLAYHKGEIDNSTRNPVVFNNNFEYQLINNNLVFNLHYNSIQLFDVNGKLIQKNTNVDEVNIQHLKSGLYIGMVEINNQWQSFKFVHTVK